MAVNPGATNAAYNMGNASAAKVGIYDVMVTNAVGNSTVSRQVAFSLLPAATLTIQGPVNQQLASGSNATFTVNATSRPPGSTLLYQWFRNGVAIPGATSVNLTARVAPETAGAYSAQVTALVGNVTIGSVASPSFALSPFDAKAGILVYKLGGNATRTLGANETTGGINGYFVIDRINNNAAIIQTFGTGLGRRNSLEVRDDIAAASTGPVPGSRTVFAGSINSGNAPIDHDLVWLTGRDAEVTLAPASASPAKPAVKIFAPPTLNGILGVLERNGFSVGIDSFTTTLSLDYQLTLAAYQNGLSLQDAIREIRSAASTAGFRNQEEYP
jgi:hypothetical protein